MFLFGQVASSSPRKACTCQFAYVIGRVTSSNPRTARTCLCVYDFGRVTSSDPRTTRTCLSAFIPGQVPSSIQEQLVPVNLLLVSYLPCYLLSCQCLPIPQWIRHLLLVPTLVCLAFIIQMLHSIHDIRKCTSVFLRPNTVQMLIFKYLRPVKPMDSVS